MARGDGEPLLEAQGGAEGVLHCVGVVDALCDADCVPLFEPEAEVQWEAEAQRKGVELPVVHALRLRVAMLVVEATGVRVVDAEMLLEVLLEALPTAPVQRPRMTMPYVADRAAQLAP